MNENYLVTKSNYFIMNSSYDLSLQEQKIILTLASMVQPDDEEFKSYDFKISDFMKLLDIEDQSKYTEIPKITKELMKKVFEIQEGKKLIQIAWLSSAIYEKGSGYVELAFSPYLKPYMLKLNNMFTQYKLSNILSMKSKYSPRIYEFLKCNEFKKQGYIKIEITELRKLLKADNVYPRYNDFKRKVIIQVQKELKKKTDISFEFEEIKTGRKVTSLKFYIRSNKKISANEEVVATKIEAIDEEKQDKPYIEEIKQIIKNVLDIKISNQIAEQFYSASQGNKEFNDDPVRLIYEVANYSKKQNIKSNLIGWFKSTLKNYIRPTVKPPVNNFNNYKQRQYNYKNLEKKLLGWDKEE